MTNLKAVIPVAGLGMHMLPATKAIPKEMLPIVDKPMIQYIVDEIVAAGIKEILLVTHASKNAVENHFDTSYELESLLEQRVKRQLLAEVQSICPPGVTIMNVRQGEPLGLGHSILCARPAIGDNPFVVVLPDVVIDDASADPLRYNLAAMIARFNETGRSQVLAKRMPGDLSEYSVIQTKEPLDREGKVSRIVEFIEKPDQPQMLDSDIMAVGRYVLSADIRDNIKKIIDLEKPSIIIAESIWALQALPIEISARIHCVIHDVATDFFKEMFVSHNEVVRKILFFNDYLKLKITEENIIKRLRVEQFIFLTEEDKCWYKTRYNIDEGCCSLASNHLYVEKIKRTINFQTPFLLIPGSIEFSQNFYGLNWFIKNIYPGLNRKIRIVVTGKASDKKIKMLNCGEEITFTGELDFSTYNKLSSTCLCVIAPITTGTGIKIKILEAVQKGIPVLTTKFASKGICSDLCFYCEEDTDTNFVNLINSFLETTLRVQE